MIAEPRPRATSRRREPSDAICPACRLPSEGHPHAWTCRGCDRSFAEVAGINDLRLAPDRYLSLDEDRAKARRLEEIASTADIETLALAYYAMTEDVDARRAARFVAHLAAAEARAEAFAGLLPHSGRILDLGCGSGGVMLAASRRGLRVDGVDIALRWLVIARQRLTKRKISNSGQVDLAAANAEHLPWPDSTFDTVFADSLIEHLDDPALALREAFRVAMPGARLILVSPNRWSILVDPHTGLLGLGWLPAKWQARYVRARRGCGWQIQLRSASEAARIATESGWTVRRVEAAPSPMGGRVAWLYDRARALPGIATILRWFGPLWLVVATREVSP